MKIRIQKLGNIQNSEFDLKPLTILVGPNNTGKTWLAYVVSAIFGPPGVNSYAEAYGQDQLPKVYPPLDNAINQVLTYGNAKIDVYSFAEKYSEEYFNNVARFSNNWMSNFMSTRYAHFDDINISIALEETKAMLLQKIKDSSFRSSISNGALSISKKAKEDIIYIYTSSETEDNEPITRNIPDEDIKERLTLRVMQTIHRALFPKVRVFPTERTAIITFNFRGPTPKARNLSSLSDEKAQALIKALEKAFQEVQEVPPWQSRTENEQQLKAAIGPVGNFTSMINEILTFTPEKIESRKKATERNPRIQKYCDLAEILEKNILAGGVTLSTDEPPARRDILFQPMPNTNLEISITSSMVKELSSLVLYLRYIAMPGDLVVIDEPEMNLHPLAQVQITEILAALVNAGLNILKKRAGSPTPFEGVG